MTQNPIQSYAPAISISPAAPAPDQQYDIDGSGFDAQYGYATVEVFTPVGVGWVAAQVQSDGTFVVTNFSADGAGAYHIDVWQKLGHKDRIVATLDFTV